MLYISCYFTKAQSETNVLIWASPLFQILSGKLILFAVKEGSTKARYSSAPELSSYFFPNQSMAHALQIYLHVFCNMCDRVLVNMNLCTHCLNKRELEAIVHTALHLFIQQPYLPMIYPVEYMILNVFKFFEVTYNFQ